jgi:hypothetical protein
MKCRDGISLPKEARHGKGAALDLPGSTAALEVEELKNFMYSIHC